ncbi:hypothetical protein B0H10DRAFT_1986417 [Mycena sp. CBHHK59/15]|nr:hypothetical protein B0H10DRAFT_2040848 [Mycena sp. CBHHK59/15]KAJ6629727.1 hypothetical protein B0H10DRAFT_1986417 [Mycena sp. CBHHK59/15]
MMRTLQTSQRMIRMCHFSMSSRTRLGSKLRPQTFHQPLTSVSHPAQWLTALSGQVGMPKIFGHTMTMERLGQREFWRTRPSARRSE